MTLLLSEEDGSYKETDLSDSILLTKVGERDGA